MQDSLFVSPEMNASAQSTRKRNIVRGGTTDSKDIRRFATVDRNGIQNSSVATTKISKALGGGSTCTRQNKPSHRNRVVMKSIDADTTMDGGSIDASRLDSSQIMRDANNNSIFGG